MSTTTKSPGAISAVLKSFAVALSFCFASISAVHAQVAVPCPPNIDFSFGNFQNWTCYTGDWMGGTFNNQTLSGPVPGRHDLTTGTGTDKYGFFPVVAPGGGIFSVKLGSEATGYLAEKIQYYIHVPIGFNNYSFNFRYACVLENPASHPLADQPRFTVVAKDSATGNQVLCATQTFIADPSLLGLGFQTSTVLSPEGIYPFFLPWTNGNLNLSGQGGKTMIIEVMAADCGQGGHFGYGYFDVISCGQFAAAITYCDLKSGILTLDGPPGYQGYKWYNSTYTNQIGNVKTINVPAPNTPSFYNLVLTPFASNGCPDTVKTPVLANFTIDAKPDSICNSLGKPIQFTTTTTGGLGNFHYEWTHDTTIIGWNNTPSQWYSCCPMAAPNSAGYYVVTVTDTNHCFRQDTVKIENPTFHLNLGPDLTTCLGTQIHLNPTLTPGGAGYVFTWTQGSGLSNTTIINPVFTPSAVGTNQYVLRVDSGICATSDTMNIRTLPNDFNVVDTALCEGEFFNPHVFGDGNFTYKWTPNVNLTVDTGQRPLIKSDTTRTYTITARYPTCPDIVKTINFRVEPIPRVSLGSDTVSKCLYQPVFLTTHVTPTWFTNYTYKWSTNDFIDKLTSPIITYIGNQDSTLRVTVRTPLGCRGRDSVRIHIFPGNFGTISPIDPAMCPRNKVTLTAGGGVSYRWEPALYLNNPNTGSVVSSPVTTTNYAVYITDNHGCVDTMHTNVTVHPEAVVSLPDSVVLYPGQSYQLNPGGNLLYYNWFPTLALSPNASSSNPVATPLVNTRYYVNGTTEEGCAASDSIYVIVRDESAINMANAFSPGSQPNAIYKVSHLGLANLKSFRIYNRWGQLLFETHDIEQGWDGTFNGAPQPMGVYIYTVEATNNDNKPFVKQGNVTLLR